MNRRFDVPQLPRRALATLIAVAAGASSAQAPAPPPAAPAAPARAAAPMPAPAANPVFAIRGFQVEGENPLGEAQTQAVLAPFVRPDATMDTLQQATAALEQAMRDKGFGLHRVALPPQEVGATVKLNIVTFAIGKVAIEGAQIYDEANIRRTVPELREGTTPNFKRMAVQTAIANENPNKQVQVGLRESDEPDRIDATISVREQRPWTFAVSLSNVGGTPNTGRDRLSVSGGHTNLFDRDHQFVGAYTTSLDSPSDVKQLGLAYKVPLYQLGGVAGLSYTRSDVVGNFGTFTSTGAGHTFGANYTWYLPPDGGRRSYVTLAIDDKVFEAPVTSGVPVTGQDQRSRPVSLSYTARSETDDSIFAYDVGVAVNTGSGDDNNLGAYRSQDPRIDTAAWKALRGGISFSSKFADSWLWSARGLFQWSEDALIAGEQFGIGGASSVRGTRTERPVLGDAGLSASLEATTPEVAPGLRFVGFLDAGYVRSNIAAPPHRPPSDRLAGFGLGLRWFRGNFSFTADYGRLLLGSRVPLAVNPSSPQRGDSRLYVTATYRL